MRCPLMALSGHPTCTYECLLSGVKRTWRERAVMWLMTQSGHRAPQAENGLSDLLERMFIKRHRTLGLLLAYFASN
jgi:hypothetical protein